MSFNIATPGAGGQRRADSTKPRGPYGENGRLPTAKTGVTTGRQVAWGSSGRERVTAAGCSAPSRALETQSGRTPPSRPRTPRIGEVLVLGERTTTPQAPSLQTVLAASSWSGPMSGADRLGRNGRRTSNSMRSSHGVQPSRITGPPRPTADQHGDPVVERGHGTPPSRA